MTEETDSNEVTSTDPAQPDQPSTDEVTAKLIDLGIEEAVAKDVMFSMGITSLEDLSMLTEADLVAAGVKPVPARKLLASLQPVQPTQVVSDSAAVGMAFDILPSVPDDASWLAALRAGGVLKVDQSTVISAIRAALASRVGLFDIPGKLNDLMEDFADRNDEQVDPEFFKLRKQLTRRTYGDIFSAIDGLDGNYVTDKRKKELFRRVDSHLWPAISSFNSQLRAWQEAWMQGAANPAIMMAAMLGTGTGGVLPPGMMQPPDTGVLRDHALAVNDAINRVFAGTGVQIASALAYDASEIRKTLENSRLPSLIGVANREQMLKALNVAVSPTYPRLEANLTRFVLGVMQADNQPAGDDELRYFSALVMLGSQIPWDQLGEGTRGYTGIAGDRGRL